MQVFNKIADLRLYLKNKGVIGFVPTMGALHNGHVSLVKESVNQCDITVSSIFVNPTQFNNPDDLKRYPRTLEADCRLLEQNDCDIVFAPAIEEVYPDGYRLLDIDFGYLEKVMEGKFRPGHFRGVATVVKRLFDIVEPQKAFFGQKDYQQLMVIKELVKRYQISTQIVGCPIIRESDGLAMSSRNMLLSEAERKEAGNICRILTLAKELWKKEDVNFIKQVVKNEFGKTNLQLEYFEIAGSENLQLIGTKEDTKNVIACVAAYCGKVRLIDNMFL